MVEALHARTPDRIFMRRLVQQAPDDVCRAVLALLHLKRTADDPSNVNLTVFRDYGFNDIGALLVDLWHYDVLAIEHGKLVLHPALASCASLVPRRARDAKVVPFERRVKGRRDREAVHHG